ncbi:MAG: hypothetical protein VX836_16120 [Pseudomonadota bacterium]|jgi:hypothetical protein|nr:hypothetical protein [Gammaproteobacteria bacterium]MEC9359384.1 hypothetical protein [Pseudomonadota bacterium]
MAGKKQSPSTQSNYTEFEDDDTAAEGWEDDAAEVEPEDETPAASGASRDWRDVERYREERALRKLIEDEFDDFGDLDDKPRKRR